MKLFLVILIISLNVSANAYSQRIDLSVTNAPLREVMQQVRKQTGYNFFFRSEILKVAKPVSVVLKQVNIDEALKAIFKDQPFYYEIKDNGILIKNKPKKNLFEKVIDAIKAITIRGKVVDEDGKPLPGASVKAGGKTTIANAEGEFAIEGIDEGSTVEVSYIGYQTASVKAGSGFITMALKSTSAELQETIIKGYYKTSKELNTGAVGSIKSVDIAKQPIGDPLMALEGRIPGLYVSQNSGVPGASLNVNIRGLNSISNGNDPLFIVDGIPFNSQSLSKSPNAARSSLSPFMSIRPNDIESIDVLKVSIALSCQEEG